MKTQWAAHSKMATLHTRTHTTVTGVDLYGEVQSSSIQLCCVLLCSAITHEVDMQHAADHEHK